MMESVAVPAKLLFLVLLGPVAALYDFATSPAAPPAIFAAQFEASFGRPPPPILKPIIKARVPKRVFVTQG